MSSEELVKKTVVLNVQHIVVKKFLGKMSCLTELQKEVKEETGKAGKNFCIFLNRKRSLKTPEFFYKPEVIS